MCGFFNFFPLSDVIDLMKYAIYRLEIISISAIHEDEGGRKKDEVAT